MKYCIRKLNKHDFDRGILETLQQLSYFHKQNIKHDQFIDFINFMPVNTHIYVIVDRYTHKVIASSTIIFEEKIIHNMGVVCHIEDLVVHEHYRNSKIGKMLLNFIIDKAKEDKKCYKIILNCSEKNRVFYEKHNFKQKNVEMSMYLGNSKL